METHDILLFGMPGGPELIIILVVVLLLFGGRKIPELLGGVGKGISEFKKGMSGEVNANKNESDGPA
jgi:sec-independent protein translocase protein TatA